MTREDAIHYAVRPRHPDHRDQGEAVLDRRQPLGPGHRVRRDGGPVGGAAARRVVADEADRHRAPRSRHRLRGGRARSRSTASRWRSSSSIDQRRTRSSAPTAGAASTWSRTAGSASRAGRPTSARPRLALILAHADLESITLERDLAREKARLEPRYAELDLRRPVVLAAQAGARRLRRREPAVRHRRGAAAARARLVPGHRPAQRRTASTTTAWPPTTPPTLPPRGLRRLRAPVGPRRRRRGRPRQGRADRTSHDDALARAVRRAARPTSCWRSPSACRSTAGWRPTTSSGRGPTCAGCERAGHPRPPTRPAIVLAALDRVAEELATGTLRVRAERRGHPHRHRAPGHRARRARPAPSSTPAAAATTRSPPPCGSVRQARARRRSRAGVLGAAAGAARPGRRGRRRLPARLHAPAAGPAGAAGPPPARPRLGAGARRRPPARRPRAASTCRRSAPARWPARRCRSIPTASPPTSASRRASRTRSTR